VEQQRELRHRTLSPNKAKLLHLAIADYRKFKKPLRAREIQPRRLIELNAPD
jgi:hypothetical protein